jgi:hypothetical protein
MEIFVENKASKKQTLTWTKDVPIKKKKDDDRDNKKKVAVKDS